MWGWVGGRYCCQVSPRFPSQFENFFLKNTDKNAKLYTVSICKGVKKEIILEQDQLNKPKNTLYFKTAPEKIKTENILWPLFVPPGNSGWSSQ